MWCCFFLFVVRLEFYGVELFRARDQHGVELGLGITCRGISVYKGRTHITTFAWCVGAGRVEIPLWQDLFHMKLLVVSAYIQRIIMIGSWWEKDRLRERKLGHLQGIIITTCIIMI